MDMQVLQFGRERQPVLIIDDVLPQPEDVVDIAAALGPFDAVRGNYYPGARQKAGPGDNTPAAGYFNHVCARLKTAMYNVFGITGYRIEEASFSLITTPPHDLVVRQRVPHYDTSDLSRFAILHYLCAPHHGGTGFFRHRTTGFETVSQDRAALYNQAMEIDMDLTALPPVYPSANTPLFEMTGAVEPRFNRVAVYRSACLHSALIPPGFAFDPDPRTGRLTGNIFITGH